MGLFMSLLPVLLTAYAVPGMIYSAAMMIYYAKEDSTKVNKQKAAMAFIMTGVNAGTLAMSFSMILNNNVQSLIRALG